MDANKKTLIGKLVKVMAGVKHIPKNGHNNFFHYDYATESDVSDNIRTLLVEQNVFLLTSIEDISNREITTKTQKNETITRVKIKYTFWCGETGESLEFFCYGEGQDAGDKGVYKAITGSTKYALMKSFLIPTGDDPEADSGNGKTSKSQPERPQSKPQSTQRPQPTQKPQQQQATQQQSTKPQTPASKHELMQIFNGLRIGMVEQYWQYLSGKYKALDLSDLAPAEIAEQKTILNQAKTDQAYRKKFIAMLKEQSQ